MPTTLQTPEQVAAHNAEVARKVAGQDVLAQPSPAAEFGEATSALDILAAQVQPKPGVVPEATPDAEPKPAAPKPDAAPVPPEPTPEEVAAQKRADELFKDSPGLPPNASPKSADSFTKIKLKAAQEISAREQEIAALKKQMEEAKNPTTEQLEREKELEELRQFRQKLDVDFDPKFKGFDQTVSQKREFIYAQLLKAPEITPAVIEQIKKYGGPDKINMDALLASVKDTTIKNLVNSSIADIELAKYSREQAVAAAKTNLTQYTQERQAALAQEQQGALTASVTRTDELLSKLDWFNERKTEAGADEAAKAEAQEHNKFLNDLKPQMAESLKDNSPEMKAILVTGMAQLFHLQRRVPALEAKLAAATKAATEATAKYDAIRNASRSRLPESQAPAGGIPDLGKKNADVNARPGDALDAIAKQVMEQRAAARSGQ